MTTPAGGGAPQLSASSSVGLNEDKIALHATYVTGGIQCKINCNGQKATMTFDGENIEFEVHEPSNPKPVGPGGGGSGPVHPTGGGKPGGGKQK